MPVKQLFGSILMLLCLASSASFLWLLSGSTEAKLNMPQWQSDQEANVVFAVAESPTAITMQPVNDCIAEEDLLHVLLSMQPYFDLDSLAGKTPVGVMTHSLRLWGPNMDFPTRAFADGDLARPASSEFMISSLLHHPNFLRNCSVGAPALLTDSEFGVHALTNRDGVHNSRELLAHVAQLPAATAEIGLPASTPVTTAENTSSTLKAVVQDSAKRVISTGELEWLMISLARYSVAEQRVWLNRFEQPVSFDNMVQQMCERPIGVGACGGTHIPYALCIALRMDETKSILGDETRKQAETFLQKLSSGLMEFQGPDGAWDYTWPSCISNDVTLLVPEEHAHPRMQKFVITGHQLEWMALAPASCRPSPDSIRKASQFLVREWPALSEEQLPHWKNYNPVTHAARALWLLSGVPSHDHDFVAMHVFFDRVFQESQAAATKELDR